VSIGATAETLPTDLPTTILEIKYNQQGYSGSIPTQWGLLTSVTLLDLGRNSLSKRVPTQLGSLRQLQWSSYEGYGLFTSNMLDGSLPSELGAWTGLTKVFDVQMNQLSGALPSELGRLTALTEYFVFTSNAFTSTIPTELGNLVALSSYMHLGYNYLDGATPSELGNLQIAEGLRIYQNQICDDIPTEVQELSTTVSNWYVTTGNSIGTTCGWYDGDGRFPSLGPTDTTAIEMNSGDWAGTIPTEFGVLQKVTILNLGRNSWTGPIPTQIGQLTAVSDGGSYGFMLSNKLTGTIPTQIGCLTALEAELGLDHNSITGALPTQVGSFTKLSQYFKFGDNAGLTGTLPTEIGVLTNLITYLAVDNSLISRNLPTEIGLLNLKSTLYLSNAKMTGHIVTELGAMKLENGLYLFSNQLCGDVPTEVQALSTSVNDWKVGTGNNLGTVCCAVGDMSCAPTTSPSSAPSPLPTTSAPTSIPSFAPTAVCIPGTYLDAESGRCIECSIGRYTNVETPPWPSSCALCKIGKINQATGSSECDSCPSGKLSSSDRTSCGDCDAGTFAFNSSSCEVCPEGYYAPTAQVDSCLVCGAGDHTRVPSKATTCSSCEAGTYSEALAVNCSTCEAGTASSSRADSCTSCDAGKFSGAGAASCESCGLGRYQGEKGSTYCVLCGNGTFADNPGSQACQNCAAGYFASSPGAHSCLKCSSDWGVHYHSVEGSATCDRCIDNFFEHAGGCHDCPDNAICENGATLRSMVVHAGAFRFTNTSRRVYDCPMTGNCLGGRPGLQSCRPGSFGPLCAVCTQNFFVHSAEERCEPCGDTSFLVPGLCVLALAIITGLVVWRRAQLAAWYRARQEQVDAVAQRANCFFVTMQILIIYKNTRIKVGGSNMPSPYAGMLKVLEPLSLDFVTWVPFECLFTSRSFDHYDALCFETLVPLLLLGLIVSSTLVHRRLYPRSRMDPTRPVALYVQALFLILPVISQRITNSFPCSKFDGGRISVLAAGPNIDCASDRYWFMFFYALAMMAVYPIGTPLAMFVLLAKYRDRLNPPGDDIDETVVVEQRKQDPVLAEAPIVSFALIFRPKWWWWDVYNMIRRLALTCMVGLYDTLESTTVFMVCVSIVTMVFEREAKPFVDPFLSVFTYLAAWQIVIFILYCLLIDAKFTDGSQSIVISSFCMITNIFLCLIVFFDTRAHVAKRRTRDTKRLLNIADGSNIELHSRPLSEMEGNRNGALGVRSTGNPMYDDPIYRQNGMDPQANGEANGHGIYEADAENTDNPTADGNGDTGCQTEQATNGSHVRSDEDADGLV